MKHKFTAATFAAIIAVLLAQPAEAKHHYRHHRHHYQVTDHVPVQVGIITCDNYGCRNGPVYQVARAIDQTVERIERVVGGRPAGCPHAFCGCGTSLHIFGRIIPDLNLASNWGRFPRAAPAPGMVAYRNHHVFAIEAVLDANAGIVLAYDPNSGRHLTRVHTVSLRGYRVVNPRA